MPLSGTLMTISRIYTQMAQKYIYTPVRLHLTKIIKCSFILVGGKLTKMIDCSHFFLTLPTISYYLLLFVLCIPRIRSAHDVFVKLLAENFVYLWHCITAKYQNAVRFPRMKLVRALKVWNWCHQSFIVTLVGTNLTKKALETES